MWRGHTIPDIPESICGYTISNVAPFFFYNFGVLGLLRLPLRPIEPEEPEEGSQGAWCQLVLTDGDGRVQVTHAPNFRM